MTKAILLLVAILLFRLMLPRRRRRSGTAVTPYQSVFDVAVPADVACAGLWVSGKDGDHAPQRASFETVEERLARSATSRTGEDRVRVC